MHFPFFPFQFRSVTSRCFFLGYGIYVCVSVGNAGNGHDPPVLAAKANQPGERLVVSSFKHPMECLVYRSSWLTVREYFVPFKCQKSARGVIAYQLFTRYYILYRN